MRTLERKTAFITGAASGIEFELARAFGNAGMGVMLADITVASETINRDPDSKRQARKEIIEDFAK